LTFWNQLQRLFLSGPPPSNFTIYPSSNRNKGLEMRVTRENKISTKELTVELFHIETVGF